MSAFSIQPHKAASMAVDTYFSKEDEAEKI